MEKSYFFDFCSKSNLFLKFLELSLKKFEKYGQEKAQSFEKDILQDIKNYNSNITLYQASTNGIKNNLIYQYALSKGYKKININVDVKGLNDFIEDFLFPQITYNLGPLYKTMHIILKIIHHSLLLNYFLISQIILIQMKQYYCKRIDDLNENNIKICYLLKMKN